MHACVHPFELAMIYARVADDVIGDYRAKAQAAAERRLRLFVEDCALPVHRLTSVVQHGYAPAVLREKAADLGADLLVVGKHGTSVVEDLLLGSVTLHLLAEPTCDLLIAQ